MNIRIDNSAISTLSCKRKFQLTVLEGLYGPPSEQLIFGNAFHTAVEYLDKGIPLDEAITLTLDKHPTDKLKLFTTLTFFNLQVKLPPAYVYADKQFIEYKFCFPYGHHIMPDGSWVNIELVGTIDRIYYDNKNTLHILDYKTAADVKHDSIAAKKATYALAFQRAFYTFALLKDEKTPPEIVESIKSNNYSTHIFNIFHNCKPIKFVDTDYPPFPPDYLYREVPMIINNKITEALSVISRRDQAAPHDGFTVYKACDYCDFRIACLAVGTSQELDYLSRFPRRVYNPLEFR